MGQLISCFLLKFKLKFFILKKFIHKINYFIKIHKIFILQKKCKYK